jgi:hypothetical protein
VVDTGLTARCPIGATPCSVRAGGSIRMAGGIKGARASGTLFPAGASAFGTKCRSARIGWQARASGVETESRR